jgi:hypothetical protein
MEKRTKTSVGLPAVDDYMSDEDLTVAAERIKAACNWERLPKLADTFQHRPCENRYWHELVAIVLSGLSSEGKQAWAKK